MNKIEQIKELTKELLYHCHLYYDLDKPEISDYAYDKKLDELKKLEDEANFWLANSPTRKVQGQLLEGFNKVTHSKPMLSAAKTKDVDEIKKFIGKNDFYCSYKLDGLTLVVIYENGQFKQAITRGTGLIGEDVTEQAKMICNLPMSIPYTDRLELRGECVIDWEQFKKINVTLEKPYSHPRNLAAGSLRQLDTNITKSRGLSYVVFECVSDLYDNEDLFDSKWDELGYLDYLGFETVYRCVGSIDNCIEEMQPEWYKYPVDGLIFEICNKEYSKSLASTSHHEGCRMALKWADTEYETTLKDIEWNTSRNGIISPVAIFEEVDLDGALTTRATLHNVSIIEELELGIGDTITVYRANMVIPKIAENLTRSNTYTIPRKCPCCGEDAFIIRTDGSKVLVCVNSNCPAKNLAKFTHFVSKKCMNILGLSEATLETLISHGFINKFIDIYHLEEHRNKLICLDGYGVKSIDKLIKSIEESKNVTLDRFICALGIEQIGTSAAKTISQYSEGSFDRFKELLDDNFDFTQLDDFGEIMTNNLNSYVAHNYNDIIELANEMNFIIPEKVVVANNALSGKTLCVTGKLNHFTRDSINEKIVSLGAKAANSVSKNTDYLVTNEVSGSSKYKKAVELGVPIITEDEFISMIGD